MHSADAETIAALEAAPIEGLIARDFVTFTVRDSTTGDPEDFAFWNGLDTYDVNVIDGATGNEDSRSFTGSGTILSVGKITLVTGLRVKQVTVTLSAIHEEVALMVRGHNCRFAQVEIHRGLYSTVSHRLVAPPRLHFMGQVNDVDIGTPAIGGEAGIQMHCLGQTIELTRSNPAKRSDATQRKRSGDRFYRYTEIMGEVNVPWGTK